VVDLFCVVFYVGVLCLPVVHALWFLLKTDANTVELFCLVWKLLVEGHTKNTIYSYYTRRMHTIKLKHKKKKK
jgi:hypothetical protein